MREDLIVACPECDLLQRMVPLHVGGIARCCRCFSILYKNKKHGLEMALALIMTAAFFYIIANTYPVLFLEKQGIRTASTLAQAVGTLWGQNMRIMATVVMITAIGAPGVEITLLLYILFSLRRRRISGRMPLLVKLLHKVRPWQMLEVFMLGALVSFVKLGGIATVMPGIALWAYAVLTILLAAVTVSLDEQTLWSYFRQGTVLSNGKPQ